MCVCPKEKGERYRDAMAADLKKYAFIYFMALEAPVPYSISLLGSQTLNLHVCCLSAIVTGASDQIRDSKAQRKKWIKKQIIHKSY